MNLILFIHGKASAGKDQFVKGLKFTKYILSKNVLKPYVLTKEDWHQVSFLIEGRPSLFDTDDIVCIPFADEVRKELCRLDPSVDFERLCKDYSYKSKYRQQLIKIGEGYRYNNPGIWVEKHYSTLKKWNEENNGKIVCVPDMRYDTDNQGSEFEYSKEINTWGNIISFRIKIFAPLAVRLSRMSLDGIVSYLKFGINNPSETSMDHLPDKEFDYVCDNSENSNNYFPDSFKKAYSDLLYLYNKVKDYIP